MSEEVWVWARQDGKRYAHLVLQSSIPFAKQKPRCDPDFPASMSEVTTGPVQFCATCASVSGKLVVRSIDERRPREPRINPKSAKARTLSLFGGDK